MTEWRGPWIALLLTLVSGCAPVRHLPPGETLPREELLRRVDSRNSRITTLRAGGSITLESPDNSSSGSFDLYLKKPDSLRMEFRGPFGIHVGTLSLSRDTFLFYNWHENSSISGRPDKETLFQVFRIRLGFDDILNVLTGQFPLPAGEPTAPMAYSADNDEYLLRYSENSTKTEYRIDGSRYTVTSFRRTDGTGAPLIVAHAADINGDDEIPMPRLIRVVFPGESRSMTVSYDECEINRPVVCAFTRPGRSEH